MTDQPQFTPNQDHPRQPYPQGQDYQPPSNQGYPQPPQGQNPYWQPVTPPPEKKRKRVFMWVFIAIQVIFLIWLITGLVSASHGGADAHAQAVRWCADKSNWQYLYHSQADCVTHYGNGLNDAGDVGNAIGAGLVIGLWVAVDIILGIGRLIVVFARRR